MPYLFLLIAILCEVVATTALKASKSFTVLWPSLVVVVGYAVAFYCLSKCLAWLSVGPVYAMWSGLGIVLITIAAAIFYKQIPDGWAILGMALIIAGVLVMNFLSHSVSQ